MGGSRRHAVAILCVQMWVLVGAAASAAEVLQYACDSRNLELSSFPFRDTKLSDSERVDDLVSRLTLEEKLQQVVNKAGEISRLGVPRYQWWNEGLHGVVSSPGVDFNGTIHCATSFPAPILTSASFNMTTLALDRPEF